MKEWPLANMQDAQVPLVDYIHDSKDTFAATVMLKTDSDTSEVQAFDKELRKIPQNFDIMEISLI